MKKTTIKIIVCSFIATIALTACNKEQNEGPDGIPFRTGEDCKWGMMSTDGKVLFDNEFKNTPTVSYNGRFMVKNDKDTWDLYSTEEGPRQVAGGFLEIADFTESVTPAVKEGQDITLIDKEGKAVATLDKADDKNIIAVSEFSEGLARFKVNGKEAGETLMGMLDTNGDVVIKAEYYDLAGCCDGKILAIKEKYGKDYEEDKKENVKCTVLDKSGKELCEINLGKYDPIHGYVNGYLPVRVKDGDTYKYGILDEKGEPVINPTDKIEYISDIHNEMFIYGKDDQYGIMNMKGEVIIRAKYDNIDWATDELLWTATKNDEGNYKWSLMNIKGENVGNDAYSQVHKSFDGKVIPVKVSDKVWTFIDCEGKEVKEKDVAEFYEMNIFGADSWIHSDKYDWDALMQAINITKDCMGGFGLMMTPQQLVEIAKTNNPEEYTEDIIPDFWHTDHISYSKELNGLKWDVTAFYLCNMADGNYDDFGNYRDSWTTEKPFCIQLNIYGEKYERLKDVLFVKVVERAKSYGKVYKENTNAAIITCGTNKAFIISKRDDCVNIMRQDNIDFQYIDISQYETGNHTSNDYNESPDTIPDEYR